MSTPFALGTFSVAGCPPFAGVVINDRVLAVAALQPICTLMGRPLSAPESVLGLLHDWERNFVVLRASVVELQRDDGWLHGSIRADQVTTHPPVLYPRQILCARDDGHARPVSGTIYAHAKLPSAITGPNDPVMIPGALQVGASLELAVVIGKAARHVPRDDALSYVAGYMLATNISSRSQDGPSPSAGWVLGDSSPSLLPLGPYLVPGAFVPDPRRLHVTLRLNGEVTHDASLADTLGAMAWLVEKLSAHIQLWPGDLICIGSPGANGARTHRSLQPDDVLEGSISGLGAQRHSCVAEVC